MSDFCDDNFLFVTKSIERQKRDVFMVGSNRRGHFSHTLSTYNIKNFSFVAWGRDETLNSPKEIKCRHKQFSWSTQARTITYWLYPIFHFSVTFLSVFPCFTWFACHRCIDRCSFFLPRMAYVGKFFISTLFEIPHCLQ